VNVELGLALYEVVHRNNYILWTKPIIGFEMDGRKGAY
jgi:hypothetical protein